LTGLWNTGFATPFGRGKVRASVIDPRLYVGATAAWTESVSSPGIARGVRTKLRPREDPAFLSP
jgi:hypothetical protein